MSSFCADLTQVLLMRGIECKSLANLKLMREVEFKYVMK